MLWNLSVSVEIRVLNALICSGGKLWPYSTRFLSYDLPAVSKKYCYNDISWLFFSVKVFTSRSQWTVVNQDGRGRVRFFMFCWTWWRKMELKRWRISRLKLIGLNRFSCSKQTFKYSMYTIFLFFRGKSQSRVERPDSACKQANERGTRWNVSSQL